jgi:hypothetical protein
LRDISCKTCPISSSQLCGHWKKLFHSDQDKIFDYIKNHIREAIGRNEEELARAVEDLPTVSINARVQCIAEELLPKSEETICTVIDKSGGGSAE